MEGSNLTYLGVFGAGLISFFSPCVLLLAPAFLSYLTGVKADSIRQGRFDRSAAFIRGLGFILGFSMIFVAIGAAATILGRMFYSYRDLLVRAGGG
ncbi:MAG TPA: hypothetical protein DEA47_00920 [Peptococcaceae bacterium]|nr:MAG: hypothetical protein XD50_1607 [Clostridia bacterium 41_269]HBT19926.1 hypothetical protein [Peptococcaceae bacterium]